MKTLLVLFSVVVVVFGHGRFIKPKSRSSIWRFASFQDQNPPVNYQDDNIDCGGILQEDHPGSKCGVCGDPISDPQPRNNEIGGKYDRGIITDTYESGQDISVQAEITIFHKGFMEWRLCSNASRETQECFDSNVLQLKDGTGSKVSATGIGVHKALLKLPDGVTCERCVIQWIYRGGDKTPLDGPQRNYRGCADVMIV